jgi:phosphoserine phosphatase
LNTSSPTPLSARAEAFVNSVLALDLKLAVFDCDGTLWKLDSGSLFFQWAQTRGFLPSDALQWILPRYAQYLADHSIAEEVMCGDMVTIHSGLSEDFLRAEAEAFWHEQIHGCIFPEMFKLTHALKDRGVDLWAISSTNNWVVQVGAEYFGIPREHVLAAEVHVEKGLATNRLVRVPSGPDKAVAIREVIRRTPDAVFGNSIHDFDMLELARHPFAIHPNPDLRAIAEQRGWPIYEPLQ